MGFFEDILEIFAGKSKARRVKKQVVSTAPRRRSAGESNVSENDWKKDAAKRQLEVWKQAAAKEDELSKKRKMDAELKKV